MPRVLFLQRKTHLAGAQRSLLRLMSQPAIRDYRPLLICEDHGWLYRQSIDRGIEAQVISFPKGRSLTGRLYGNRLFARRVCNRLALSPGEPLLVHGNEYDESLVTIAIADLLGCPSVLSLRNAGMSVRHWRKYRCSRHDRVIVTSPMMHQRVLTWTTADQVRLVHNGIDDSEFTVVQAPAPRVKRIAVLGSALPIKGWQDLAVSLQALDKEPVSHGLDVDFIGRCDVADPTAAFGLARLTRIRTRFVGVKEAFADTLLDYDLVVNPSRGETFGMAMVEAIGAGRPLLTTRTGVAEELILDPRYLVAPADTDELTERLRDLLINGLPDQVELEAAQQRLRDRFSLERTARDMIALYDELLSTPPHRG